MIIGISGHMGAGKSTVCEVAINLVRPGGLPFIRIGFSDPLYKMLIAMGVPEDLVYNKHQWDEPLDVLCGRSIRYACDKLGNDYGRDMIGKEVWTRLGLERAKLHRSREHVPIIDNVRYLNEARAIVDAGGVVIAFTAPVLANLTKPSEREIPEIHERYCRANFHNTKKDLHADALNFRKVLDAIVTQC